MIQSRVLIKKCIGQFYRTFILVSLFSVFIISCAKEDTDDTAAVSKTDSVKLLNYSYGKNSLQKMDIYLQKGRTSSTPLLICIHGGGWIEGDKNDIDPTLFLQSGFNVLNINYRLANNKDITCKDMMDDIGSALTKISENSENWNIRKNSFVIYGFSAGAHLSMLYAYKYDFLNQVSAVISYGGPTKLDEFQSFDNNISQMINSMTGINWNGAGTIPESYKKYSPFYSNNYKPTFFIHGEKDTFIPLEQSELMHNRLIEKEINTDFFILSDAGHGGEGASQQQQEQIFMELYNWVLKNS